MIEEPMPPGDPREPILDPQHAPVEIEQEPASLGWKLAAALVAMLAVLAVAYGWLQHDAAQQLASERDELRASLVQTKSQEDALAAKVNALSLAAQEQAAHNDAEAAARLQAESAKDEQFLPQTSAAPLRRRSHTAVVRRRAPVEDARWKQFQQQLGEQQSALAENQKELAANKQSIAETQANLDLAKSDMNSNLQSARTELGGDIARNHSELVVLQKRGERNYYEFSFEKSKTFHHTGPISVALRKADVKHEYCDLEMMVDDKDISRKHVNLYESISLYPEGYPQPVEVVINRIDKDSIHGYVSEPKYRTTEQAGAVGPDQTTTSAAVKPPDSAPPSDVKLERRDPQTIVH